MGAINYKRKEASLELGDSNEVIIRFPLEYRVKLAILKACRTPLYTKGPCEAYAVHLIGT